MSLITLGGLATCKSTTGACTSHETRKVISPHKTGVYNKPHNRKNEPRNRSGGSSQPVDPPRFSRTKTGVSDEPHNRSEGLATCKSTTGACTSHETRKCRLYASPKPCAKSWQ
ncbi:hypothetical protein T484DRAFT_1745969 [Baffinella frigidus]|nr:hypothetical protein T484DRAFT_1745969 [Cryptophyta sp. CCMP2293]